MSSKSAAQPFGRVVSQNRYSAVSLFSGCGGLDLGFIFSGRFEIVFANDIMPAAVESYRQNIGEHIHLGDISQIPVFPRADVVIGGPPCQGFSNANPRRGVGDQRNWLFTEYLRALKQIRPLVFVMENVPGIRTLAKGAFYAEMKSDFKRAGYRLFDDLLDAAHFNVPQNRIRNFLVGVSVQNGQYRFPAAESLPGLFGGPVTVGQVLIDTPFPVSIANHQPSVSSPLNSKRLLHIPEGGSMADCPPHLRNNSDPKRAMRRLHRDVPSHTIVHNNCDHFYHPVENRRITIREMARIQTFPDSFIFYGSKSDQSVQVANAVPINMAKAVAHSVAEFLDSLESVDNGRS